MSKMGVAVKRARVIALLVLALTALLPASAALADGDPASDVLLTNQAFLGATGGAPSSAQRQLVATLAAANRAGYTIRVAVIGAQYDLGSVTALWQKPRLYAHFLGLELTLAYKQRLLVVMPNGFGFSWPGHSTAAEYRVLARVPLKAAPSGLLSAASVAVRQLAAANGVTLPRIRPSSGAGGSANSSGVARFLILAAIVAALATAILLARARSRRRPTTKRARPAQSARPLPLRLHLTVAIVAVGVAVATAVVVVLLTRGNRSTRHTAAAVASAGSVPSTAASKVVTPPPISWPAGARAAPGFRLRDQYGRTVSLAAYRGRPVIVTFIDPLCRNYCPLEARVLNQAVRQTPAWRRPVVLAVSVNVYGDARANLLTDVRKWSLVPEWNWAIGSSAQLARVWSDYKIGVQIKRQRVGGTTINSVIHTEAAYVVDRTGHERALFIWPFYPQDVLRVLRQLA